MDIPEMNQFCFSDRTRARVVPSMPFRSTCSSFQFAVRFHYEIHSQWRTQIHSQLRQSGPLMPPSLRTRQKWIANSNAVPRGIAMQCKT